MLVGLFSRGKPQELQACGRLPHRIDDWTDLLRVLFFVEPVIFRDDPLLFRPHVEWALDVATHSSDGECLVAVATNPDLCNLGRAMAGQHGACVQFFDLDPFAATKAQGYDRAAYCRALYGLADEPNPIVEQLEEAVSRFDPQVVVLTSQNAYAEKAFSGRLTLRIELSPLPRMGHPWRMMVDPCGHQKGSLLERHAERLLQLSLATNLASELAGMLAATRDQAPALNPRSLCALDSLKTLRENHRVALFVLQPPDYPSIEGAYGLISPERLVLQWAERLPPGWVGVPTYHPAWRFPQPMEVALARACDRLRFLPHEGSQGTTEALLTQADAIVTVSSTTAMTALLWGKLVIVVGQSPFAAWCPQDLSALDSMQPLATDETVSLFAFLCHRYSHRFDRFLREPGYFYSLASELQTLEDPTAWMLDLSSFDIVRAKAMFTLPNLGMPD